MSFLRIRYNISMGNIKKKIINIRHLGNTQIYIHNHNRKYLKKKEEKLQKKLMRFELSFQTFFHGAFSQLKVTKSI